MIRYFYHKIEIIHLFFFFIPPPHSAFRAHTSAIVARAKVYVSRSFYQCHVIHDTHISCGSDDVTRLSEQSERQINAVQVRLRHIHVNKSRQILSTFTTHSDTVSIFSQSLDLPHTHS